MTKSAIIRIVLAILIVVAVVRVLTYFSARPGNLGVTNGRLAELPGSPNAVCSQTSEANSHYVDPLPLPANPQQPIQQLAAVVQGMSGSHIIAQTDDYLQLEFRSRVFGFVDDVEFQLDPELGVIHVRSASRMGYSDFGTNRKRVEEIRRRWAAAP